MGRSGSGLCLTRNRPDQIGWSEFQPTADRSGWADPTFNGWQLVWLELEIEKWAKI